MFFVTRNNLIYITFFAAFFTVPALSNAESDSVKDTGNKTYKITLGIAQHPQDYFLSLAKSFKSKIKENSNGRIKVEIERDVAKHRGKDETILQRIENNKQTMGQVYTQSLAKNVDPSFNVFNLPFIFKNYDHVDEVFEGRVGKAILNNFEGTKFVGLGYTFSGGFSNIATQKRDINNYEDFKDIKVHAYSGEVNEDIMSHLNADAKYYKNGTLPNDESANIENALKYDYVNAAQVAAPDAFLAFKPNKNAARVLNLTRHKLTTTVLVMDRNTFESMPDKLQNIVREAATKAARTERQHVINDAQKVLEDLKEQGVKIVRMNSKQRDRMHKHLQPVYDKWVPIVGESLVKQTHNIGNEFDLIKHAKSEQ